MTDFDNNRFGLITGSMCSVLFPKKSAEVGQRTYAEELAQQMFFKFYDDSGTWQTDHGNDMEPFAFDHYKQYYNSQVTPGMFAMKDNYYGGTCDALCPDYGIDFKCPTSLKNWTKYLKGIEESQYHQAQMYMYLFDRDKWKVAAFLQETWRMTEQGKVYPVSIEKRMIINTVQKEPGWVELLHERGAKLIEWRNDYFKELQKHFS
jgi:hypothetical protein